MKREARVTEGVKIKKLKVKPSAGRVFYRVYEKGHAELIPDIKKVVKKEVAKFESYSILLYRDFGDSFVFIGSVTPDEGNSNERAADKDVIPEHLSAIVTAAKISSAIADEVKFKLKKVMLEIAGRELNVKNFSTEIEEFPVISAADELGIDNTFSSSDSFAGRIPVSAGAVSAADK